MKHKIIILAVLLIAGAAFLFIDTSHTKNPKKESTPPVFEVSDAVSGKSLSSSELKDKVIFVHFWASW